MDTRAIGITGADGTMNSRITNGPTEKLFKAKILGKHRIQYYRCKETGFIQTENPYWLEEAYSSAISSLDLGLVTRNILFSNETERIIVNFFDADQYFLDYAGGYGLFTRFMRDKGFNFYHTDKFCENIFARYFELKDAPPEKKFELLTAFEVFEHLLDPVKDIGEMFQYSDNVLFSTETIPSNSIEKIEDWWYFVPETGQHISLYSLKSLESIAEKYKCNFHTNKTTMHLFTKKTFPCNPLRPLREKFLLRKLRRWVRKLESARRPPYKSLLGKDLEYVRGQLNSSDE